MSSKTVLTLFGRLPLLFVVDSISRGTFLNFALGSHSQGTTLLSASSHNKPVEDNLLLQVLWSLVSFLVTLLSVLLLFSPIRFILDFYRWTMGAALIWLSYYCNKRYVQGTLTSVMDEHKATLMANVTETLPMTLQPVAMNYSSNLAIQLVISLAFDQISVARVLDVKRRWVARSRYPVDILLYMSFSLPIFMESALAHSSVFAVSVTLSIFLPLFVLACHLLCAVYRVSQEVIVPGVLRCMTGIRDMGIDGVLISIMERANFSWLLRLFFITQVLFQLMFSKTLHDSDGSVKSFVDKEVLKKLALEILYNMCGTLISIMSLASIVTIISGFSLSCVYKVIQANEDEESLQPVVSGFLFVLCAMQTGITSVTGDLRLQLLFQNSVLLIVANQHFVHTVATDLLLKASIDDTSLERHLRPLIPFFFFFSFPFLVVMPLWSYPFRVSWLLAVTVFCIELIVKSVSTIIVYSINMLHIHTNAFTEDTENLIFYVKGVCGCLEFVCGIFLFLNGAYIFIFESGGFIRLFMMTIHFYCNIYQSMIKGWATYKLRLSSWDTVNKLEAATQEQLDENDICSICYQEMKDAVSLRCYHIFHKNCIQKWLSIKESCPLCHGVLKKDNPESEVDADR